jgi:aminopeptidase
MHEKMKDSARRSLEAVLSLRPNERFLAITDDVKGPIGQAFRDAALELGCEAELYMLDPAIRPLQELPADLAEAIEPTTVVVNCFQAFPEETPFRIALIRNLIADHPRRVGHAPGITEDMMISGPMDVSFSAIQEKALTLMSSLRQASYARITAPGGTDLTVYLEGRAWDTDTQIGKGSIGNLPCGEIWCAPVEGIGEGLLVCDGSVGDLGAVPAPVHITVDRGQVASVQCADQDFLNRVEEFLTVDKEAKVLGEFGIGINPKARITGNLLEDEKAFRTAHIAFGNNEEMPGGKNRSRTHRDFLFRDPTIVIHNVDGHAFRIVEDGLVSV